MRNFTLTSPDGKTYERISKQKARRIYDTSNKAIITCGCNMNPFSPWGIGTPIVNQPDRTFDQICNEAEYYNCDSERGRYLSFYAEVESCPT